MEASTAVSSRLIGAFFVEKGLVTQEQLELALQKQEQSGERLGEIIVAEFGVSRLELASVLAEQWAEFERESKARDEQARAATPVVPEAPPVEPGPSGRAPDEAAPAEPLLRRPIGEIFLERGFVTRDDLDKALDVQRQTGTRLGEVLVEQGSLSRLDLASALAEQWSSLQKLRPPDPVPAEPWQNGAPAEPEPAEDLPGDLRQVLEELEDRVRTLERAAAATPWNEDLRLLGDNVRAALATVEERVLKAQAAVDPAQLETLAAALDELRQRVQEPDARLDAVERRLVELPSLEALEGRLEARLDELRSALESSAAAAPAASADELAALRAALDDLSSRSASVDELSGLRARLDELALRMVVPEALAEVRGDLTALSRAVPPPEELNALRASLDELAANRASADEVAALQASLQELAARTVTNDELAVLRDALSELSSHVASEEELRSLHARVDELAAAAAAPDDEIAALRARLDELAVHAVVPEALVEMRAELSALAQTVAPAEQVSSLRSSLDALSAGSARTDELESLRARVDELAGSVAAADELAAVRSRIDELAARTVEPEAIARMQAELATLAQRPSVVPAELDELRNRLGALADRVAAAPATDPEVDAAIAAIAGDAEAVRTDLAALKPQVEELSALLPRVDELSALLPRVDELSQRLPAQHEEAVGDLRRRLDELAARAADDVPRAEHEAVLQELTARIDELGGRVQSIDTRNTEPSGPRLREILDGLRSELDAVAARPVADAEALQEVRVELTRLAAEAAAERSALEQELRDRIDRIAAAAPDAADLSELRARVDALATRDEALLGTTEERLSGIEGALSALEGAEWRLQTMLEESVAVRASDLEQRVETSLQRLDALADLERRLEELQADIEAHPAAGALDEVAAGLRDELARLADRVGRQERALTDLPAPVDPTQRLDDLGLRLDGQARLNAERLGTLRDELHARLDEAESALRRETADGVAGVEGRVDDLTARTAAFVSRDDMRSSIAEQGAAIAAELAELRRTSAEREETLSQRLAALADRASVERIEERLAEHDRQLADTGLQDDLASLRTELHDFGATLESRLAQTIDDVRRETADRAQESGQALSHELDRRAAALGDRLGSQEAGLAALRDELEQLRAVASGQEEWRRQIEAQVHERVEELERRLGTDSSEVRERVERTEQVLTSEIRSLAARLDELVGSRDQDLQAAQRASDELAARVAELHALRDEDAEAARIAAGELAARMETLATSLRREAAAATEAASTANEQIDRLAGLREDDLEASRIAGAELVARLDDLAIRTAAAAAEADRALRSDLHTLAATLEEQGAASIEAREELRLELERGASSLGWRLERIEEALAGDDHGRLRDAMAELERRLDEQVAIHDEQVRVTERALRKGLASLGERLVETEAGYFEAGKALRRSIERLGAAVVEADARMADQIPVGEGEGYVAFAPTNDGYRLVQVEGAAPELGAAVEIEGVDGPLVVTRLGRSPLPLDSRPCAYLDRA